MDIHASGFHSIIPWWSFTTKCPLIKCQLMYNFHRQNMMEVECDVAMWYGHFLHCISYFTVNSII